VIFIVDMRRDPRRDLVVIIRRHAVSAEGELSVGREVCGPDSG
jgi:hypothetical protein